MNRTALLAAFVAAIVFFILGALWYSLLQGPWLAGVGKSYEQLLAEQGGSALPYVVGFLAVLVMCLTLAWLILRTGTRGLLAGATLGAGVAVGIVGSALALNYGFEWRAPALWLINVGYVLLGLTVAGGIIGGWARHA
jgi:hypothetical protein